MWPNPFAAVPASTLPPAGKGSGAAVARPIRAPSFGGSIVPRHPDTAVTPNLRLQDARRRLPSPLRPGKCMSRSEFVTAVNSRLHTDGVLDADIDYDYVVKLEAGRHRWPRDE